MKSVARKSKDDKTFARNMQQKKCSHCGKQHKPREFLAYGQICRKWKKMNYWASCSMLQTVHEATKENHDEFLIKEVIIDERQQQNRNKQTVAFAVIRLNGKRVKAKLDTGAEVNVMPLRVLSQIAD